MDKETKDQEDRRVTEARDAAQVLRDRPYLDPEVVEEIAGDIENLLAYAEENQRARNVLEDFMNRAFQGPSSGGWYICPSPDELAEIRALLGMDA